MCGGLCCKGLRLNIGAVKDADARRWIEFHGELSGGVFTVDVPCKKLRPDGRCDVYDSRPNACVRFEVGGESCRDAIKRYGGERVNEILASLEK